MQLIRAHDDDQSNKQQQGIVIVAGYDAGPVGFRL
jgi:hypothetical protein